MTLQEARRLGDDRDAGGLERVFATRNQGLLYGYADAFSVSRYHVAAVKAKQPDLVPQDVEAVLVKHYADVPANFMRYKFLDWTRYTSRALFDRLYESCEAGPFREEILMTDQPGIEAPILELLKPRIGEDSGVARRRGQELLRHGLPAFFQRRRYSPAAPVLESLIEDLPANDPLARNVEDALVQSQQSETSTAVLKRLVKLQTAGDRASEEVDRLISSIAALPPEAAPSVEELREALPPHLSSQQRWPLIKMKARMDWRELPFKAEVAEMSQEDCEASRGQSLRIGDDEQNACYGLVHGRLDVFDACKRHPIDFNAGCHGRQGPQFAKLPLAIALESRLDSVVDDLIARGVDVKRDNLPWQFVLSCAREPSELGVCRRILASLVRAGVDPNKPPLIWATTDSEGMLTALLDLGADINILSERNPFGVDEGCTALDVAYRHQEAGKVAILQRHGGRSTEKCLLDDKLLSVVGPPRAWTFLVGCAIFGCSFH